MPNVVIAEETFAHLRQWSIIDVRSHEQYDNGHIEGARWMNAESAVKVALEKFEKNEKFVLYDQGDGDQTAYNVAEELENAGFTGVSVLQGGYTEWMRHHYPNKRKVERTPSPRRVR